MKIHLILSTDKNLKVYDWTPFYNKKSGSDIINIIEKDNLISHSLDALNIEGWHVKSTFNDNKYFYFLLVKNIEIERKYSLLNNNLSEDNGSEDNGSEDNGSEDNGSEDNQLVNNESDIMDDKLLTQTRKMSQYVNIVPNSSDEELDYNYLTIDNTNI
jgi:hypothetical protein